MRASLGLVALLALVVSGCSSSGTPAQSSTIPPELATKLEGVTAIAALGDSVPYGSACVCTPYPELTGDDLASAAGHRVDTSNEAVPGAVSGDVLAQLNDDPKVIQRVEDSQAVIVEVGANDVAHSSACGEDVACYDEKLPQLTTNLDAIVTRIRALTAGHRVTIVLLDYWSVWLGGQYATDQGPEYVDAANAVTASVADAIRSTAASSASIYVDLRRVSRAGVHSGRDRSARPRRRPSERGGPRAHRGSAHAGCDRVPVGKGWRSFSARSR